MKAIWENTVIAESNDTIVVEDNHYFPPDSIKKDCFTPSATHSTCPWKGLASYYQRAGRRQGQSRCRLVLSGAQGCRQANQKLRRFLARRECERVIDSRLDEDFAARLLHGGKHRGFLRAIAEYIQLKLDIPAEYVSGIPWQERESLFDCGEIQLLWLCGLPYVHKADLAESSMELLAVPVPVGERYRAKPVYFSDVVVRRDSPFRSFRDLRGATWAYNEPRSHSGYNVVRAYLFELGEFDSFFAAVVEAGAHSNSLQMILSGAVDGAAIDSTVLEWLGSQRACLADEIRVSTPWARARFRPG